MAEQLALPLGFNPQLGFEQYWPGPHGEVLAHLRDAARNLREELIVIWGGPGTGKTHLLNACCAEAAQAGRSATYLPLSLLREYGPEALEGLTDYAVVCLDDLQSIAGDPAIERALFAFFNQARDAGRRLLASATRPPQQLPFGLPDLASRLAWGLTLRLQELDDDDTLQAVTLKARSLGLELPPPVGRFLLQHVRRDLSALNALLIKLDGASLAAQRKLTIPFVKLHLD